MKSTSLTFTSVIAAIGASLCCLGPTIAVFLGLGTFGLASAFEAARPYLLALVGMLLAGAFYQTYRSRAAEACANGACPVPTRRQKALLWIGLAATILFAAFPYYSGLFWANGVLAVAFANSPTSSRTATSVRSASLHIEGMFCGGCAAMVESALSHVDGVRHVSVNLDKKSATVEYDPSKANIKHLEAAVWAAGYTATVAKPDSE